MLATIDKYSLGMLRPELVTSATYDYSRLLDYNGIGEVGTNTSPSEGVQYRSSRYQVSGFNWPVVVDAHYRVSVLGMMPPGVAPSVSAGAGTTAQVCYWRFYDEYTDEYSPLSSGTSITGNTTRTWSSIPLTQSEQFVNEGVYTGTVTNGVSSVALGKPGDYVEFSINPGARYQLLTTTKLDDTSANFTGGRYKIYAPLRATHISLWVSVSGTLPREALKVRIGTSTIIESTPTLSLGAAETEPFDPMPAGHIAAIYADRLWIVGADDPSKIYGSATFFPERYEGVNFRTKSGADITGLFAARDALLVTTRNSIEILQGYTESDLTLRPFSTTIGCISQQMGCIVDETVFLGHESGLWMYNGALHDMTVERSTEWRGLISAVPAGYRDYRILFDPVDKVILAFIRADIVTLPWVFHLPASMYKGGGGDVSYPQITQDYLDTPAYGHCLTTVVSTGKKKLLTYVAETGVPFSICEYSQTVAPGSPVILVSPFLSYLDPGGCSEEGKTLLKVHPYIVTEGATTNLRVFSGDEFCYPADRMNSSWFDAEYLPADLAYTNNYIGQYQIVLDASQQRLTDPGTFPTPLTPIEDYEEVFYARKVHHALPPVERCSGRGFVLEIVANPQVGFKFLGYTFIYGPGPVTRNPVYVALGGE